MVTLHDLKRISDYEWEIPKSFRDDMQRAGALICNPANAGRRDER